MKVWVVGFMFDLKGENVVLLKKNRPHWQKGLFNGVGGHVKQGESAFEAITREFKEEAGVHFEAWNMFAIFRGLDGDYNDCICYFLYGLGNARQFAEARTVTDEVIMKFPVDDLPKNLVKNLPWLIPLCFDDGVKRPLRFEGVFPQ